MTILREMVQNADILQATLLLNVQAVTPDPQCCFPPRGFRAAPCGTAVCFIATTWLTFYSGPDRVKPPKQAYSHSYDRPAWSEAAHVHNWKTPCDVGRNILGPEMFPKLHLGGSTALWNSPTSRRLGLLPDAEVDNTREDGGSGK